MSPPPQSPGEDETEESTLLLTHRVQQVLAIAFVAWSANMAIGRGSAPGQMPFFLGLVAVSLVSTERRVTAAILVTACGLLEWLVWPSLPSPWALPPPLASLLVPTVLLATLNVWRPRQPGRSITAGNDPHDDNEPAWRMIVFGSPLMLVMLVAMFRYK